MNARQKAKKYKRMYEELLKQTVNFKVEQYKIDTVRFKRYYPPEFVIQECDSYLRETIIKDIAQSLAENLDKYINCRTEFCPDENSYYIYGEIKVVNRKE